jgi:hypothetical protein
MKTTPAFKALEKVLAALAPLDPEGRRRVIEAVHALLPISPGKKQDQDQEKPAAKKRRR